MSARVKGLPVHKSTDGARGARHAKARQAVGPVVRHTGSVSPSELDDLRIRCWFSRRQAAAFLGVTKRTYQRWQHRGAPWWAGVLLRYQAGESPWEGWDGWRFGHGELWPPGYRQAVTPGQVLAVPYRMQLIADLKRQIREFWSLDDQADCLPLVDNLPR